MYEYSCTVDRVVDGDTIDVTLDLGFSVLYKSRVRLYGIDTPESRTRNLDEKARGKLAAKYLQGAIALAEKIIIQTELKDSRVPILSNSTNSESVRASLVIILPFSTYLAGLVYSSITSIGENGAL